MPPPPPHPRDPVGASAVVVLLFLLLAGYRLGTPSIPYFDEVHYLPAARALLEGSDWLNREHPPFAKLVLACGVALFGDSPAGWRSMPLLVSGLSLWALMRAMWHASGRRFATIAFGVLMATGFALFVHARIAMLDSVMVAALAVTAWQFAAAVAEPEHGRRSLIVTGIAIGLAIASKWNAAPLAPLPGLALAAMRLRSAGLGGLFGRRSWPVPGIRLPEAAVWLGVLPLTIYALSFLPLWLIAGDEFPAGGFVGLQEMMLRMQESVVKPHPYQSTWIDWVIDRRAIWYLYEPVDGAQRGVLLIGNPLTMLLGLPAMLWAAWAGMRGRADALAAATIYAVSLGFWIVAAKPIQFYYHYYVPSIALLAALALALHRLREGGRGWLAWSVLAGSIAMFAWFYPILSAAPLSGERAFERWMWVDSWR